MTDILTVDSTQRLAERLYAGEDPSSKLSGSSASTIQNDPDKADPNDDLLAELNALRRSAKMIALFGARNIPMSHQQLIEFFIRRSQTNIFSTETHQRLL